MNIASSEFEEPDPSSPLSSALSSDCEEADTGSEFSPQCNTEKPTQQHHPSQQIVSPVSSSLYPDTDETDESDVEDLTKGLCSNPRY